MPTDQLLVMALHHFVLDREHSASIAHILNIITQKGHYIHGNTVITIHPVEHRQYL